VGEIKREPEKSSIEGRRGEEREAGEEEWEGREGRTEGNLSSRDDGGKGPEGPPISGCLQAVTEDQAVLMSKKNQYLSPC
jgi:hypothetical protein